MHVKKFNQLGITALAALAFGACETTSSAVPEGSSFEMIVPEGEERMTNYFRFAPAAKADDFIFLSGVTVRMPDPHKAKDEDYANAIRGGFERIEKILAASGADWSDVVEMTTFHVDMKRHQDIFKTVREDFITDEPYPAWTAIGVERLWLDDLFVEIRVTAYIGD